MAALASAHSVSPSACPPSPSVRNLIRVLTEGPHALLDPADFQRPPDAATELPDEHWTYRGLCEVIDARVRKLPGAELLFEFAGGEFARACLEGVNARTVALDGFELIALFGAESRQTGASHSVANALPIEFTQAVRFGFGYSETAEYNVSRGNARVKMRSVAPPAFVRGVFDTLLRASSSFVFVHVDCHQDGIPRDGQLPLVLVDVLFHSGRATTSADGATISAAVAQNQTAFAEQIAWQLKDAELRRQAMQEQSMALARAHLALLSERDELSAFTIELKDDLLAQFAELDAQTSPLHHLNRLAQDLSRVTSTEQAYRAVAAGTPGVVPADRTSVALRNGSETELDLHILDVVTGLSPTSTKCATKKTMLGEVLSRREAIVADTNAEQLWTDVQSLAEVGLRSVLVVPLLSGDRIFGTLNVASFAADAFDETARRNLSQIAALLAAVLENRRLIGRTQGSLQRAREDAHRMEALNELALTLSRTRTREEVYRAMQGPVSSLLASDHLSFAVLDQHGSRFSLLNAAFGGESEIRSTQNTAIERVRNLGRLMPRPHLTADPYPADDAMFPSAVQAALHIPFSIRGRVTGVMNVGWYTPNAFIRSDEQAAIQIGTLVSKTLENHYLLERSERALREARRSELALQQANHVIENSSVVLFRWQGRAGGDATFVSQNVSVYGPSADDFLSGVLSFEDFIHPEDRHEINVRLTTISERSVRSLSVETRLADSSNGVRWVELRVLVEEGAPTDSSAVFEGVMVDITDRKRAEARIKARETQFNTMLNRLPSAVVIGRNDGKIVYINEACQKLFRIGAEQSIGKFAEQYYESEEFRPQLRRALNADAASQFECTFRRHDGEFFWGAVSAMRLADYAGEPAILSVVMDISTRKEAEAHLSRAKEAAEAASQAKGEFLANMSHEIRTPMNGVIGMTSLLLDTALSAEQQDFVQTIRMSGDTLLSLINDILDFSKIESGKLELELEPFSLRRCVEEAVDLVAPSAGNKSLELAFFVDDTVPDTVIGDITRLRQVIVNLLNNAIKFTDLGEVSMRVSAASNRGEHSDLHFVVTDTGVGIPPDRLDSLFESFTQVDASTTRKYGGTGLGLAISKQLVELMGGSIDADSQGVPGAGSVFRFNILARATSVPDTTAHDFPELSGREVLIVDDIAINRQIISHYLSKWNVLTLEAESGPDALEILKTHHDVALGVLDLRMPQMDGIALAQAIRETGASFPLVLLSSINQNESERTEHFTASLNKPIKPKQLHRALASALGAPSLSRGGMSIEDDRRPASGARLRILLAEDNVVNRKVALGILKYLGYEADVAVNGLEALEAVQANTYDVVLMDVQMPELDGLEATRQIRADAQLHQPYVIALTANAMERDRDACLEAGMDDHVSKPVQRAELLAALETAELATQELIRRP